MLELVLLQESFREQYRQGRLEDRIVVIEVPRPQMQSLDLSDLQATVALVSLTSTLWLT